MESRSNGETITQKLLELLPGTMLSAGLYNKALEAGVIQPWNNLPCVEMFRNCKGMAAAGRPAHAKEFLDFMEKQAVDGCELLFRFVCFPLHLKWPTNALGRVILRFSQMGLVLEA